MVHSHTLAVMSATPSASRASREQAMGEHESGGRGLLKLSNFLSRSLSTSHALGGDTSLVYDLKMAYLLLQLPPSFTPSPLLLFCSVPFPLPALPPLPSSLFYPYLLYHSLLHPCPPPPPPSSTAFPPPSLPSSTPSLPWIRSSHSSSW